MIHKGRRRAWRCARRPWILRAYGARWCQRCHEDVGVKIPAGSREVYDFELLHTLCEAP
jgi:hypothetical protein